MNDGILGTARARGGDPSRPFATATEARDGTSPRLVLSPASLASASRATGREWMAEWFTDFAFDFSGNFAGSDGLIFANGSSGAGSGVEIFTNGSDSFPGFPTAGIATLATGTTTTGRGAIYSWQSRPASARVGSVYCETLAYIPALATASEDYVLRIGAVRESGLGNWPIVAWEYDRANSSNWSAIALDTTSNQTRVGLGVPVVAGQWLRLGIVMIGTVARFFINGYEAGSISPGTIGAPWFGAHIIKTAGTTSRTLLLDYFYIRQNFTNPRTFS